MFRNGLEPWHIVVLVALFGALFGYKKLPDAARSVGKSLRIFKTEMADMKGLIDDEGSCALTGGGLALTADDFKNVPFLAFKGDYSATSAQCQTTVDAIKAAGGKADYIQLDQPGWWQGSYSGPFGADYIGPFAGVSHMHMIESNPSPLGGASNLRVMDVMLKWADMNISKPKTTSCPNSDGNNGNGNKS